MYCLLNDDEFDYPTGVERTSPIRICILGGGFGGLYTALYLQKFPQLRSSNYEITLVEPRDNFVFTPLLYEVVTGELHPWEVSPTYQKLLAKSSVKLCQDAVQNVDLQFRSVQLQSGATIAYDYLVVAVGSETRLDLVPGAATYAQTFRNLTDAEHLKERLRFLESSNRPLIRVSVIGGGPNGIEIACKLADRLKHRGAVNLIERGDQLLKNFTPGSRKAAQRALRKRGVQVRLNSQIEAIHADRIILTHAGQSQTLESDLVLWTAGTQVSDWVRDLICRHNPQGQLISLSTLQLIDYPEVFALGDTAEILDGHGKRVPATAQAAYQQADCAAKNLWRSLSGRPLLQFRYLHLGEMLTLGAGAAVVSSFGITLDGKLAQVIRKWVYAQRLPTLSHRLQVMGHWIANGVLRWLPDRWKPRRTGKPVSKSQSVELKDYRRRA